MNILLAGEILKVPYPDVIVFAYAKNDQNIKKKKTKNSNGLSSVNSAISQNQQQSQK